MYMKTGEKITNSCLERNGTVYTAIRIETMKKVCHKYLKHKPNNKNHCDARNDVSMILNYKFVAENRRTFITLPTSRNRHLRVYTSFWYN